MPEVGSAPAMLRVLLQDLDQVPPSALACLSPQELTDASAMVRAHDAHRQGAARAWLRSVLAHAVQGDAASLSLQRGEQGKPWLSAPMSPAFNLSHSGPLGALALAEGHQVQQVGIDIELLAQAHGLWQTRQQFMSLQEIAWVSRQPPHLHDLLSLLCWTRKEAVLKAWGIGLHHDLPSLEAGATESDGVVPERGERPRCQVRTRVTPAGVQPGWVLSVAWVGPDDLPVSWPDGLTQPNQSIW